MTDPLRAALREAIARIGTSPAKVSVEYRKGWMDALKAVESDAALAATPEPALGCQFDPDGYCVIHGGEWHDGYATAQTDAALAATPEPAEGLRAAAREMYDHIMAHEDAMGHGYCATQSGDYIDSCTCGFEESSERWSNALKEASEQ